MFVNIVLRLGGASCIRLAVVGVEGTLLSALRSANNIGPSWSTSILSGSPMNLPCVGPCDASTPLCFLEVRCTPILTLVLGVASPPALSGCGCSWAAALVVCGPAVAEAAAWSV